MDAKKHQWLPWGILLGALAMDDALAETPWVNWQSGNVQYLRGWNYNTDPHTNFFTDGGDEHDVITIEYFNDWRYGDNFIFADITAPTDQGTEVYGELSPRLSAGKISGLDLGLGPIKDVLLAGNMELGKNNRAFLLGPGLALNLPGFTYADLNLYARKSERDFIKRDTNWGWQVTFDWLVPLPIGRFQFLTEGFIDYAFGEGGGAAPKRDNIIAAPRLLLDVGALWGKANVVQAGVEYQYWHHQYGVSGQHESVPQLMAKWMF
jgi:nucleoside-specific outer membrane channel protein Tsx